LNGTRLAKRVFSWLGIAPQRSLPALADKPFSEAFKTLAQPECLTKEAVLLNDTYIQFNHPEIGMAAVKVLNALGYRVIVPAWSCCGRPAFSKGLLPKARAQAQALVQTLMPYALRGLKIVVLEPSCLSALTDDYRDLVDREWARPVLDACVSLEAFAAQVGKLLFNDKKAHVKIHGHCHQKALAGIEPALKLLRSNPAFTVEAIASGCCGMAGSFGYEKEHYGISMKIGSLKLFPAVNAAPPDTRIVANGISCRTQIQDGTGRRAVHLAELLAEFIE
jgi:Fe-S oxidoreductase